MLFAFISLQITRIAGTQGNYPAVCGLRIPVASRFAANGLRHELRVSEVGALRVKDSDSAPDRICVPVG